jgi:tyrosyl-tRNA synthetase
MAIATAELTTASPASAPARNAYDVLRERGLYYQCSDDEGLRKTLGTTQVIAYGGFDPTADSLQIGNIVLVMALAHLQRAGHKIIAIVGGGTAMIGDPTGKTAARRIMPREEIDRNVQVIKGQLSRYLDLSGDRGIMVDNADWLLALNYVEFLRDYGRHFSVNEMIRAETYRSRLETGLTFLEFNYMLLQAYDFLELFRRYGCTVQVGGSDQWANVLAGADLIRRVEGKQAFAYTFPLVTDASGQKMGKTAGGKTVWLDPGKMSPYDFYQFWINVDDADVKPYLAFFTFLPMVEIDQITAVSGAGLRGAKERLAYEATALAHGEAAAREAQTAARALFGDATLEELATSDSVPSVEIDRARLDAGIQAVDLLVHAGLADSKGAAKRLIEQGGAYLNNERLSVRTVTTGDLAQGVLLLRAGKKRYMRVVPT